MNADVIVIGAGAAGLAAARALAKCSVRVALVEARDRSGGRIYTRTIDSIAAPVELGAEFIHGAAPETLALLRETGGTAVEMGDESWICAGGSLRREVRDFTEAAKLFEAAAELPRDVSVDDYLKPFAADPSTRAEAALARAFVEGFDAADPAIASARGIAEEWESGSDVTSSRPCGTYAPIVAHLHGDCLARGVSMLFSAAVQRIKWKRGEVSVDAHPATLRAGAAVVTLPAGVLRRRDVVFDPGLPHEKYAALECIEMGDVTKVAMAFRVPFWEDLERGTYRDAAIFRCENGPFGAYWTQFPQRNRLVYAWAGGPSATALAALSEADRVAAAVRGFGALFNEEDLALGELIDAVTHDWRADPYARGAYSYLRVGAHDARARLADSLDDTVFFAGEATSADGQGGTVNGAIQTGERAALEVLQCRF
ncbi:MAG: FAD-dependent oxidoreductase [Candidatus Eremiobacteraeota bacterium]|nr:FAD-dependent oxidoreductase [Candidatus Eremiobacteraeota bacterium]